MHFDNKEGMQIWRFYRNVAMAAEPSHVCVKKNQAWETQTVDKCKIVVYKMCWCKVRIWRKKQLYYLNALIYHVNINMT